MKNVTDKSRLSPEASAVVIHQFSSCQLFVILAKFAGMHTKTLSGRHSRAKARTHFLDKICHSGMVLTWKAIAILDR